MDQGITLHQLDVFLAVVEAKSFSKAASNLRISQPSVSLQIKQLEGSLGIRLFDRLGRAIYLTREGELLLEHAKRMSSWLSNLRSDLEDLKGIKVGRLLVGASRVPSSTTLPLAFALFKKKYPQTNIVVKAALSSQVEQWILDNDADLAVVGGDPVSKSIVREPYYEEELLLAIPPEHRLARKSRILPRDILEEPFLLPYTGRVAKFIDTAFAKNKMVLSHQVTLGSREAV